MSPPNRRQPTLADLADLLGRDVVVGHHGARGLTMIRSYVVDVSLDGVNIEVAAAPGHLFPLREVTFLEDADAVDGTVRR